MNFGFSPSPEKSPVGRDAPKCQRPGSREGTPPAPLTPQGGRPRPGTARPASARDPRAHVVCRNPPPGFAGSRCPSAGGEARNGRGVSGAGGYSSLHPALPGPGPVGARPGLPLPPRNFTSRPRGRLGLRRTRTHAGPRGPVGPPRAFLRPTPPGAEGPTPGLQPWGPWGGAERGGRGGRHPHIPSRPPRLPAGEGRLRAAAPRPCPPPRPGPGATPEGAP